MSEFWEQYRRPEWQKRRLEVMESAKFLCEECGAADKTLNVHHKLYVKGRKVWQYERNELCCLCEGCHERFHTLKQELLSLIGKGACGIEFLIGFVRAAASPSDDNPFDGDPVKIENRQQASGAGKFFDLSATDIEMMADGRTKGFVNWWHLSTAWLSGTAETDCLSGYITKWSLPERGLSDEQVGELLTYDNIDAIYRGETITISGDKSFTLETLETLTNKEAM